VFFASTFLTVSANIIPMKKLLLVVGFIVVMISGSVFGEDLIEYNLRDCMDDRPMSVFVNLDNNQVRFQWIVEGHTINKLTSIIEVKDNIVLTDRFSYNDLAKPNTWYGKSKRLAFKNTTIQLEIHPELKKVYMIWNTYNTSDKKINKAFKKVFGGTFNNSRDPNYCSSLQVFKTNKGNKKIIGGNDSTVVAASSGTGFFVSSNGHMVTNYHVIEECNSVKVHYKGSEKEAQVLFTDKTNDLAIIKANVKPDKVYAVSDEDVSLLEDIIVAGFPLGKKISASIKTSKGSVTALAGYGDNYSNFQMDAALNSGNSGGPIMDQKGNILGVAVAHYGKESGVESFNFGVKSSTLKTFANSNNFKFTPASQDELSNKDLGKLITEATIYLECWMSVAKIKQLIAEEESRKAFFSEYK